MASEIWRLWAVLAAYLGRAVDRTSVVIVAGGDTVSGIAGGGLTISRGAREARRPPILGKLSRLEIEIIKYLRDYSGH
jgi:hypothetical protein